MAVITRISQQKNKSRVNIYLDGKFGFGIDLDNFVKHNLKVEQNLSEEEIEKIKETSDFAKTYNHLLLYASLRPRSEKEIRDWLKRKKIPESFYEKLFAKLKHLEMIGDEKFAKWWIESRLTFKKKSKRELIFELRKKGIEKNIIENVLAGFDIDEVKTAKELLGKKSYRWDKLPLPERKRKSTEYLARKGFGWDTINSILKK